MQLKVALLLGALVLAATAAGVCPCPEKQIYDSKANTCGSPDATIDNCRIYTNDGKKCTVCEGVFFVKSGKCEAATEITNCARYSSKTLCAGCDAEYYLQPDFKSCNAYPTGDKAIENCKLYATSDSKTPKCAQCEVEYYADGDKSCKKLSELDVQCTSAVKVGDKYQCASCNAGYYINDKKCSENPTDAKKGFVQGCNQYQKDGDNAKCIGCEGVNALKTTKDGKTITCEDPTSTVEDCGKYSWSWDTKDGETYCSSCEANSLPTMDAKFHVTECKVCPWDPSSFGFVLQFGLALVAVLALAF